MDQTVAERMRADWNKRAREDAHYYVAFGKRDQDDQAFLATAADAIRDLEGELKRLPKGVAPSSRRALEIGCGPGRLMRFMSRHFGEIHGIDVSDEMIAQAGQRLEDIPHAHAHHGNGSDLALFEDDYFDFVYSLFVFQHIPSAEVVFSYLRETVRVLKPGGFARLQINGLPKSARPYTTWEGVGISSDEIRVFTAQQGVRLLSLTGVDTQYMWTSWQKPLPCRIRQVVNAFSQEQAVPSTGRLACATLQIENLPEECDLNSLEGFIDGVRGTNSYIGPKLWGLSQFNVFLPPGVRRGLVPVRVEWNGRLLCPEATVRVIPPGPLAPRLTKLSDGINLLSQRIESGWLIATVEDADSIDDFRATVDGIEVSRIDPYKTDPLALRYEVNFHLPAGIGAGGHVLEIHLGKTMLTRMGIEVVG